MDSRIRSRNSYNNLCYNRSSSKSILLITKVVEVVRLHVRFRRSSSGLVEPLVLISLCFSLFTILGFAAVPESARILGDPLFPFGVDPSGVGLADVTGFDPSVALALPGAMRLAVEIFGAT